MQLIKENLLKISIIEKSGTRIRLDASTKKTSHQVTKEIEQALKRSAEIRWYYLPETSFEVIKTAIPPGHEQPWHTNCRLHEATLLIKGQIMVFENHKGKVSKALLHENDFVLFEKGPDTYHTMKNPGQEYAYTLTYKFVGPDMKDRELFKTDWHRKK